MYMYTVVAAGRSPGGQREELRGRGLHLRRCSIAPFAVAVWFVTSVADVRALSRERDGARCAVCAQGSHMAHGALIAGATATSLRSDTSVCAATRHTCQPVALSRRGGHLWCTKGAITHAGGAKIEPGVIVIQYHAELNRSEPLALYDPTGRETLGLPPETGSNWIPNKKRRHTRARHGQHQRGGPAHGPEAWRTAPR